jgi:hypothetical protein
LSTSATCPPSVPDSCSHLPTILQDGGDGRCHTLPLGSEPRSTVSGARSGVEPLEWRVWGASKGICALSSGFALWQDPRHGLPPSGPPAIVAHYARYRVRAEAGQLRSSSHESWLFRQVIDTRRGRIGARALRCSQRCPGPRPCPSAKPRLTVRKSATQFHRRTRFPLCHWLTGHSSSRTRHPLNHRFTLLVLAHP